MQTAEFSVPILVPHPATCEEDVLTRQVSVDSVPSMQVAEAVIAVPPPPAQFIDTALSPRRVVELFRTFHSDVLDFAKRLKSVCTEREFELLHISTALLTDPAGNISPKAEIAIRLVPPPPSYARAASEREIEEQGGDVDEVPLAEDDAAFYCAVPIELEIAYFSDGKRGWDVADGMIPASNLGAFTATPTTTPGVSPYTGPQAPPTSGQGSGHGLFPSPNLGSSQPSSSGAPPPFEMPPAHSASGAEGKDSGSSGMGGPVQSTDSYDPKKLRDEDIEEEIRLRARVVTPCYNSCLTEAGLLDDIVYRKTRLFPEYLQFHSITSIVDSIAKLLNHRFPIRLRDVQVLKDAIPADEELVKAWEGHAEGKCAGCDFSKVLPTSWEAYIAAPFSEQVALLERLRNNFREKVCQSFDGQYDASAARQQSVNKAILQYTAGLLAPLFQYRHWSTSDGWNWGKILDPALLQCIDLDLLLTVSKSDLSAWLNGATSASAVQLAPWFRRDKFKEIVVEETPGAWTFPCFRQEFCAALVEELRRYENTNLPKFRPNSMNNYGVILNEIGLHPFITALCRLAFFEIGQLLLPMFAENSLDHHHTFVVEYGEGRDVFLDMHVDDSEVTFNVNICDTFEGSSLVLCGMSGEPSRRKHQNTYTHALGKALVHAGAQRHGALPITKGERYNLIVWTRSSQSREMEAIRHSRGECTCDRKFGKHKDELDPDAVCLSLTHDKDYHLWKGKTGSTPTGSS